MPLLPTHALLANDPAKQACYGFKRKSVSDSHIDFSIPLSYNDILNSPPTDIEEKARWALVKKNIHSCVDQGHYSPHSNAYFAYEIGSNSSNIGVIGCISDKDLKIKIVEHEATHTHRVNAFTSYLETVGLQAEPCVIAFKYTIEWQEIEVIIRKLKPYRSFEIQGVPHRIWLIEQNQYDVFNRIYMFFRQSDKPYVLIDGHHRKQAIHHFNREINSADLLSYCLPHTAIKSKSFVWSSQKITPGMVDWIQNVAEIVESAPKQLTKSPIVLFRVYGKWFKIKTQQLQETLLVTDSKLKHEKIKINKHPQIESIQDIDQKNPNTPLLIFFTPISAYQLLHWSKEKLCLPAKTTYMEPKILTGLFLQLM